MMEHVTLLDGVFKTSQDLGKTYLLYLDVDRLIAPCYEAAGEQPKAKRYGGWESRQISGHSIGHWLSAAATMYAVTRDKELKRKLDYAIDELAHVQAFDADGYVSGFPRDCFDEVFTGDFQVAHFNLANSWVPWYSIHKIYAGLIDAHRLTGSSKALDVVIKLADWAKKGTDRLDDEQFERMLICEHGGMNEVFADLYILTNNKDYLDLAERFCQKLILDPLSKGIDELEGKHANTQIPKVIGAAKLHEITGKKYYRHIALFFWEQVVKRRSYVFGGNSNREHFGPEDVEELGIMSGETCNTYNMLKLTEILYSWERKAEYMDFYERALYNHILASQDPESGMKMYFIPTQPGHFKIYSSPDDSFWCCVGTGMENPARYTRSIYSFGENGIYINLFIASQYEDLRTGLKLVQHTSFPEEDTTRLTIERWNATYRELHIRVPYWVAGDVVVTVNGDKQSYRVKNGYITLERPWEAGDEIVVTMPMALHKYVAKGFEAQSLGAQGVDAKGLDARDLDEQGLGGNRLGAHGYGSNASGSNGIVDAGVDDTVEGAGAELVAFMYGPIVLAGQLGRENYPDSDILDDHLKLNNHPLIDVPTLVTAEKDITQWVKPIKGEALAFQIDAIGQPGDVSIKLVPFYALHHERYSMYWKLMDERTYEESLKHVDEALEQLERLTVDVVQPSEQQPEVEHGVQMHQSQTGYTHIVRRGWRNSRGEGGYFSYKLAVEPEEEMQLLVTYCCVQDHLHDEGIWYERRFKVFVDDIEIAHETLQGRQLDVLFDIVYPLPRSLTEGKQKIEVRFESSAGKLAGPVYGIRTMRSE